MLPRTTGPRCSPGVRRRVEHRNRARRRRAAYRVVIRRWHSPFYASLQLSALLHRRDARLCGSWPPRDWPWRSSRTRARGSYLADESPYHPFGLEAIFFERVDLRTARVPAAWHCLMPGCPSSARRRNRRGARYQRRSICAPDDIQGLETIWATWTLRSQAPNRASRLFS